MDEAKKKTSYITITISALVTAFVVIKLSGVLTPFLIAFFLAYLFNPLVNKLSSLSLKNKKLPRLLSVLIIFLMLMFLSAILILWLIPILITQLSHLVTNLAHWFEIIEKEWLPWIAQYMDIKLTDWNLDKSKRLLAEHGKQISVAMGSVTGILLQSGMSIVSWVVQFGVILVVLFYLLRDWPVLIIKMQKELSIYSFGQRAITLIAKGEGVLRVFFRGQLSVMAALGLIYAIGLSLLGLNYAILLGFISGLLSIVPYLGGAVGLTLSLFVGYLQFHDWPSLVLILGVFGIGQVLESMLLTPYLVGDKLGLHPVFVIFAIMAGGELFGFFGVLLALPVAAVMVVLIKDVHRTRGNNDVGPTAF